MNHLNLLSWSSVSGTYQWLPASWRLRLSYDTYSLSTSHDPAARWWDPDISHLQVRGTWQLLDPVRSDSCLTVTGMCYGMGMGQLTEDSDGRDASCLCISIHILNNHHLIALHSVTLVRRPAVHPRTVSVVHNTWADIQTDWICWLLVIVRI